MTELKLPTEEEIQTKTENAELFIKAIDLVVKECSGKVNVMEMSDCLLAVGFDMLYHIISNVAPEASTEEHIEAINGHIEEIRSNLEENVWKQR
jgi:hypothetical protein